MKNLFIKKLRRFFRKRNDLFANLEPRDQKIIIEVRQQKLTYLKESKLVSLCEMCRRVVDEKLPGIFIEAGCALGGSTIVIATIKQQNRPFYVYDVFAMIPPPSEKDGNDIHQRYATIGRGESNGIKGDTYYGYEGNLYEKVWQNLQRFHIDEQQDNVFLIKGLLQETMYIEEGIAFAHIDVDWYEPVKTCLQRIVPNLIVGGSIIIDDYHDWSGCRKATDEYFQGKSEQFRMDDSVGSMSITRLKSQ